MKTLFPILILFLFSSNFAFGQIKDSENKIYVTNEMKIVTPVCTVQRQVDSTQNSLKKINQGINQSLKQVFLNNKGFKKEKNYFGSDANTIETSFGKVKLNETKRDRVASILNVIVNK